MIFGSETLGKARRVGSNSCGKMGGVLVGKEQEEERVGRRGQMGVLAIFASRSETTKAKWACSMQSLLTEKKT